MITKRYKFAVIAVDVVIFTIIDNELQVLLIKMKKKPFEKYWAAPGGLVGPEESTNDAAKRILLEKTGLGDVYLEQLYTFGEVDRDPFGRVVSVAYFALIPWGNLDLKTTEEYAGVQWFPISKFPALAYDHAEIIATAIGRLKAKLEYTNIAYGLLSETFALSELQNIYQIILQKKLDKRNFRKRILSLGIVKKSGKQRKGLPSRPADLYTFTQKKASMIQIL